MPGHLPGAGQPGQGLQFHIKGWQQLYIQLGNQDETYRYKGEEKVGMKSHKKRKLEIPQVNGNDTPIDSIIESEDKIIEQSTNQPTANDVLMALNSLGSSVTDVNDHIKSIIK